MASKKKTGMSVALAAAAGVGLYFLLGKKDAKASPGGVYVPPGDDPIVEPPPGGGGGGGGSTAPKYPPKGMSAAQIEMAEAGAVNSVMAQWCDATTGLCNKTTADMQAEAWKIVYGNVKIGSGSGWGDWKDAWGRLGDMIEDLRPYGQTVHSGGKPVNAPKYPPSKYGSLATAKLAEGAAATEATSTSCDPAAHTCSKTIEQMASMVWKSVYGSGVKIPPEEKRGTGWDPWIAAWHRIVDQIMKMTSGYNKP